MAPTAPIKGDIYEFSVDGVVATCRLWSRNDIDAARGAACAKEMLDLMVQHVLSPAAPCKGIIFDVRKGPPAFGPKTQASLEKMLGLAANVGRRFAVVVGPAMQRLQFTRLTRESGYPGASVFDAEDAAQEFVLAP